MMILQKTKNTVRQELSLKKEQMSGKMVYGRFLGNSSL